MLENNTEHKNECMANICCKKNTQISVNWSLFTTFTTYHVNPKLRIPKLRIDN